MSYRIFTAALMAAGLLFATQSFAEPTTVRGSKSNSSERTAQGAGAAAAPNRNTDARKGSPKGTGGPARATTVKSSKSNTSD
jgi:hypothetical protein